MNYAINPPTPLHHAVPLASARRRPETPKENQAGHSLERAVEGQGGGRLTLGSHDISRAPPPCSDEQSLMPCLEQGPPFLLTVRYDPLPPSSTGLVSRPFLPAALLFDV